MLSARSPKYPGLFDVESGVRFRHGKAQVTEPQARALADRRYADGILIGEFDDEGRTVNEQPAKDWRKALERGNKTTKPDDAAAGGADKPRSN